MSTYIEEDEYTHEPTDEMDFSESMYLNYFDENRQIGGFLRVANRTNEGYAEITNVTYLNDGSVLFSYQKATIEAGNLSFEAGGMAFKVVEPFKKLNLSYKGTVFHFEDPTILRDPKKAFTSSPRFDFDIDLDVNGIGEVHDNVDRGSKALEEINYWKEHYEQIVKVRGQIRFKDSTYSLEGLGLRDHSWGPRTWQSPKFYRFLSGVFDEKTGFGLMYFVSLTGKASKKGFLSIDGMNFDLKDVNIDTEYSGPEQYQHLIKLELATMKQSFNIEGKVISMLPLRNRKGGVTVRLAEGMTEWNWDGKVGYGLSEYHDHVQE